MQPEQVSLYYCEGSADKAYHVQLEPQGGGFVVNFQYGRRGATLQAGSKTTAPVEYAKAKKIFDKLVAEKTAKGYTPGESGTAFQGTSNEARVTGLLPQLLNPVVSGAELLDLLKDDSWCMQEKMDGERRLVRVIGDAVQGANRKGLEVALPQPIADALLGFPSGTEADGEQIEDVLYLFDILKVGSQDVRGLPYEKRHAMLLDLLRGVKYSGALRVVTLFRGAAEKSSRLEAIRESNGEGVVLKQLDAPYSVGRPNSGGSQRKYKFTASATVRVSGVSQGKRSVQVEAKNDSGDWAALGSVTIPANKLMPSTGDIIEVVYLYAFRGGSLYQPVFKGPRPDQGEEACATSQLKYRREGVDDEDVG